MATFPTSQRVPPAPIAAAPRPRAAGTPAGSTRGRSVLLYLLLLAGLALVIGPFLWMVLGSFKPQAEFLRLPPTWLPETWTTGNYERLFQNLDFPRFFTN